MTTIFSGVKQVAKPYCGNGIQSNDKNVFHQY